MPAGSAVLAVPYAGERLGFAFDDVREVVAGPVVTPLPTAPESVLGLFNLRGELVPLLDPAAVLGFGTTPEPAFAVVLDVEGAPVGLPCAGTPEVVALGAVVAESDRPSVRATHQAEGGPVVVVDTAAVVAAVTGSR